MIKLEYEIPECNHQISLTAVIKVYNTNFPDSVIFLDFTPTTVQFSQSFPSKWSPKLF